MLERRIVPLLAAMRCCLFLCLVAQEIEDCRMHRCMIEEDSKELDLHRHMHACNAGGKTGRHQVPRKGNGLIPADCVDGRCCEKQKQASKHLGGISGSEGSTTSVQWAVCKQGQNKERKCDANARMRAQSARV
ncbi:uncharacterized protein RAG0_16281 [Rhynchosporium agropyri]|uniref:Secreted protein n=1 Tax=Rhynchosporium agropyri TaxID=914238 RepID=A0A1E1LRH6_9HELO|nr:uncharacterized protein RAG0_16281 [Rhynchosporium agropyri]